MTHIKCRYSYPCCTYRGEKIRLVHNEYWFCDESGQCPDGCCYTEPKHKEVLNPICIYCEHVCGEFEKYVKSYEYEDGILKVFGKKYFAEEIEYLEIDERILIDRGEAE